MIRKINHLVICGSGTLQTASLSHVNAYWCDELYLRHPDFHYIICPDGKTVQMLGLHQIAGGPGRYNPHSVNIAYIGGTDEQLHTTDNRTAAQKAALLRLLRSLKEKFPAAAIRSCCDFETDIDPQQTGSHVAAAADPGFNVAAEYRHIGKQYT